MSGTPTGALFPAQDDTSRARTGLCFLKGATAGTGYKEEQSPTYNATPPGAVANGGRTFEPYTRSSPALSLAAPGQ